MQHSNKPIWRLSITQMIYLFISLVLGGLSLVLIGLLVWQLEQQIGSDAILLYQQDPLQYQQARQQLFWQSLAVIIGSLGGAAILAARLAKLYLASPLTLLDLGTEGVAQGGQVQLPIAQSMPKEMAELIAQFNKMAELVYRREQQLSRAYERLQNLTATPTPAAQHESLHPVARVLSNLGVLQDYHCALTRLHHAEENFLDAQQSKNPEQVTQARQELQRLLGEENLIFVINDMHAIMQESLYGLEGISTLVQVQCTQSQAAAAARAKLKSGPKPLLN